MKKHKWFVLLSLSVFFLFPQTLRAQYFWDNDTWDNQSIFMKYKYTELFPATLTIGVRLSTDSYSYQTTFLHMNLGFGFPSADCWKAYLPDPGSGPTPSSDGLLAMNLGMGITYYINHCLGLYTDIGWAPVMTLENQNQQDGGGRGGNGGPSSEQESIITNLAAWEVGVNVNAFKNLILSAGVVYYFKESPSITLGIGFCF